MKIMTLALLMSTFACTFTWASEKESITLSGNFLFKTCRKGLECIGPRLQDPPYPEVAEIELSPFHKGKESGLEGWHRDTVTEKGITFKSEIHIVKHAKPGKYQYYVYAMLRSGNRNGKVKKIKLKELSILGSTTITDDPIKYSEDGMIQAQYSFGSPVEMIKKE